MRRWLMIALLGSGWLVALPTLGQEAPRSIPRAVPARAEEKAKAPEPRSAPGPEVDALLDAWAKQAATRTTLQVAFERIDKSPNWGDKSYAGRAVFRGSDFCLEFTQAKLGPNHQAQRREVNGQSVLETEAQPAERIVWTQQTISQYMWDNREIYVYPSAPKLSGLIGGTLNSARRLCDLPFLFQMTTNEIKQRYAITLAPQRDPVQADKLYLIKIEPRDAIDQRWFRGAYLYLNKQTFLPDRFIVFPTDDQTRMDFHFRTIVVNEPVPDSIFVRDRIPEGWKVMGNESTPTGIERWFEELIRLNSPQSSPKVEAP